MIIPKGNQTTEAEMARAIEAYLPTCPYGAAPLKSGKKGLPNALFDNVQRFIELTAKDREVSESRPPELKWQSTVRNAYRSSTLFVKQGGGYQLVSRMRK